jgi:hypothetical protein
MKFLTPEMLFRQIQFLIKENDWGHFGDEIPLEVVND